MTQSKIESAIEKERKRCLRIAKFAREAARLESSADGVVTAHLIAVAIKDGKMPKGELPNDPNIREFD